MINKLVLENLRHRWVRTLLSALVVGVQVMSILTLIGLSRGMLNDTASRAKGTGADIFLKPGATLSLSTGQMDERFVPYISKQQHVAAAVGVLMVPVETILTLNGVNIPEFRRMNPSFQFIEDYDCGVLVDSADEFVLAIDTIRPRLDQLRANARRCSREYIDAAGSYQRLLRALESVQA